MELRSTVGLWVTVRWDGRTVIPSNVCGTGLEMFPLRFGLEEVAPRSSG